jgi:very-short-patch-repair endonuclease
VRSNALSRSRPKYGNQKVTTVDKRSPLEKLMAKAKRHDWPAELARQLDEAGIAVEREYRWHSTRKFRFDLMVRRKRLAVEVDGGLFINGGHTRGARREYDYERDAEALAPGCGAVMLAASVVFAGMFVGLAIFRLAVVIENYTQQFDNPSNLEIEPNDK